MRLDLIVSFAIEDDNDVGPKQQQNSSLQSYFGRVRFVVQYDQVHEDVAQNEQHPLPRTRCVQPVQQSEQFRSRKGLAFGTGVFVGEGVLHVRPRLFELLPFSHVFNDSSSHADGVFFRELLLRVRNGRLFRLLVHSAKWGESIIIQANVDWLSRQGLESLDVLSTLQRDGKRLNYQEEASFSIENECLADSMASATQKGRTGVILGIDGEFELRQKLNSDGQQLIMSERKLVEAFRTFFEKSVAPYVSQNDEVMREWNHLNKIIGSDPIDYSQIEFYLLLSNKGSGMNSQAKGSHNSIPSGNKLPDSDSKFRYSDFNALMEKNNFEKKGSFLSGNSTKKKSLLASLEGFQKQLLYNQERLEALSKKDGSQPAPAPPSNGLNTSANGISLRRY